MGWINSSFLRPLCVQHYKQVLWRKDFILGLIIFWIDTNKWVNKYRAWYRLTLDPLNFASNSRPMRASRDYWQDFPLLGSLPSAALLHLKPSLLSCVCDLSILAGFFYGFITLATDPVQTGAFSTCPGFWNLSLPCPLSFGLMDTCFPASTSGHVSSQKKGRHDTYKCSNVTIGNWAHKIISTYFTDTHTHIHI